MARHLYYLLSLVSFSAIIICAQIWPGAWDFLFIVIPLFLVGIYDLFQKKHALLRNFPVAGHLRYLFEGIRPEIQQYFIDSNLSGRPFNRETRSLVYQRAKKQRETIPFGTQQDILAVGYEWAEHSLMPKSPLRSEPRVLIGENTCKAPYRASRLNISAMSFGALSPTAVMAMNWGAKLGQFAQNTGEGGLSPHHLKYEGDLIWQIGTAYFGCRNPDGSFSKEQFKEKACLAAVKMIEVKLSQGAKPAHGGILPAIKVDAEIATIRGIDKGRDCISPPAHSAFDTPVGLLEFMQQLRDLSGGKPVGFKFCLGRKKEFFSIIKAMLKTNLYPDFITVDGAEGGTGAAPVEFSNHLGHALNESLSFVNNALIAAGIRQHTKIIASGKVATGFDLLTKFSLGADLCNSARAMMFATGCIQSRQCNANTCPTGVATQDKRLYKALAVENKARRIANFHEGTIESFLELLGALGLHSVDALDPSFIYRRITDREALTYREIFPPLESNILLSAPDETRFAHDWEKASAEAF